MRVMRVYLKFAKRAGLMSMITLPEAFAVVPGWRADRTRIGSSHAESRGKASFS